MVLDDLNSFDNNPQGNNEPFLENEISDIPDSEIQNGEDFEETRDHRINEGCEGFSSLDAFMKDIRNGPELLTKEDEQMLFRQLEAGKKAKKRMEKIEDETQRRMLQDKIDAAQRARERIINANLRLVVYLAKSTKDNGVALEDRIQDGNLGLMTAVEKFDYALGYRFSTYASWYIKQSIDRMANKESTMIRLPVHLEYRISQIKRFQVIFFDKNGDMPTTKEIADGLKLTENQVVVAQKQMTTITSLDAMIIASDESEGADYYNLIEDEETSHIAEDYESKERGEYIRRALENTGLNPQEQRVIRMRYGIGYPRSYTLQEVGNLIGVTRERIRQIEKSGITKMQRHLLHSRDTAAWRLEKATRVSVVKITD